MKKLIIAFLSAAVLFSGCTPPVKQPAAGNQPAAQPPSALATPASDGETLSTIQYPEDGSMIRLAYDAGLTAAAESALVAASADTPDQPYYMAHPAFVQLRFPGYAGNQPYQIPVPVDAPQIMLFQTRDFPGYGGGSPFGYAEQLAQLDGLLAGGLDPAQCGRPTSGDYLYQPLPFLPMVNAVQVFCAKPQEVTFDGGKGIRYVTYYDQGPAPKFDQAAFYTFQGRSDDGQYYISAFLPVRTGVFPAEPPAMSEQPDLAVLAAVLREQVAQINAQPDDRFTPSLAKLDALIQGIQLTGEQ